MGARTPCAGGPGVVLRTPAHGGLPGGTGLFHTAAWFDRIAAGDPGALRGPHTVLTGGEAADPRAFAQVGAACPDLALGARFRLADTAAGLSDRSARPSAWGRAGAPDDSPRDRGGADLG
ncbi:hypothetical protein [Streptomyces albireticuli]|uniref:hypothetical protein n=1 Tax=Streptomyces albireticuli TaxID=1940 RepID=UPI00117D5245|nr:hypothetical protein [Streptomyces albireticuli]MCD9144901.1 hypothetical protein [Streptomyces albireticuli]MCD9164327.1 hypothetical protein [Streptomyces albireticuli]MCD9194038.1 hypothetical protein [Streptomyces albireticuli]